MSQQVEPDMKVLNMLRIGPERAHVERRKHAMLTNHIKPLVDQPRPVSGSADAMPAVACPLPGSSRIAAGAARPAASAGWCQGHRRTIGPGPSPLQPRAGPLLPAAGPAARAGP
eukprot:CAMPEP_0168357334 /NCGR_PEP_ID=MMETSP0228-20121227/532_1 /TAXON_ID=133427 /ORGANISM="Protoceratium reticulatum, Strain CCCM 535 (=CCMP 1889)" /LENGTH=113 /DNA_ID=CAMNT_0008369847 /DNA_START=22 /DNA_END=360 /DNA_ORIENTATION=+